MEGGRELEQPYMSDVLFGLASKLAKSEYHSRTAPGSSVKFAIYTPKYCTTCMDNTRLPTPRSGTFRQIKKFVASFGQLLM